MRRREDPQLEIRPPSSQTPRSTVPTRIVRAALRPAVLLAAVAVGEALLLTLHRSSPETLGASGWWAVSPPRTFRPDPFRNIEKFPSSPDPSNRRVHLLKGGKGGEDELGLNDAFAATWWQSTERFLEQNLRSMDAVEDGSFAMFERSFEDVRMTRDWLDFSVEHLSKWWGAMLALETDDPAISERIARKLEEYVRSARNDIIVGGSKVGTEATNSTIVVVPFLPYRCKDHPSRGDTLTIAALAATLASLLRAGMGRVVVCGYYSDDVHLVQRAYTVLRDGEAVGNKSASQAARHISQVGPMEVGYVRAKNPPLTSFNDLNIPKSALLSLRRSLRGKGSTKKEGLWLGEVDGTLRWKYVYLTEPDTILQARPSALRALGESIDRGLIVVPHRLQPIPHELDAAGAGVNQRRYLPSSGVFREVVTVDASGNAACCDGGGHKPGTPPFFPKCGTFWWLCGFEKNEDDDPFKRHKRLVPYQLMRLVGGTGFVSLAGTEHGRRCIPRVRGECYPPVRNQTDTIN